MKLKQLRQWLEQVPATYDETDIVFRTVTVGEETGNFYGYDQPIVACSIDEDNMEAFFVNEESANILKNT